MEASDTAAMTVPTATTVLITGANRGIGKSLTKAYLARPHHTVIATVRDLLSPSSEEVKTLPTAEGSQLILLKLDVLSDTDTTSLIQTLTDKEKIAHLDIVIANAAVINYDEPAVKMDLPGLRETLEINLIGPLKLFQATFSLLRNAPRPPKFMALSSYVGNSAAVAEMGRYYSVSRYAASKAALNHLVRWIHVENEWLTAFTAHPGIVLTDMTFGFSKAYGHDAPPGAITPEESAASLVKLIERASRTSLEGTHGFVHYDGTALPY